MLGCHAGSVTELEKIPGKTVQWDVCDLHMNEKVFEKVFYVFERWWVQWPDGLSKGPISLKIREHQVKLYEKDPIVSFKKVECANFP